MREKIGLGILFIFAMVVGFGGNSALAGVTAKLTTAPNVPPAVKRGAETVVVHLQAKEYVGDLDEGVKYAFWSFGGTVPGRWQGFVSETALNSICLTPRVIPSPTISTFTL